MAFQPQRLLQSQRLSFKGRMGDDAPAIHSAVSADVRNGNLRRQQGREPRHGVEAAAGMGGFGVQGDEVATAVRAGIVAFTAGLRGSGRQDGLERIGRRHVCHETPQQVGVAVTVTGLPTGAASGRG